MTTFNKGEYGSKLYVNMQQAITTGTSYTVIIEPQFGDLKTFTSNITTSGINIVVDDQTYLGDAYLAYTLQDGDLDQEGSWRYRGTTTFSGTNILIKSDYKKFTVLP